jgi:hypothetical protein
LVYGPAAEVTDQYLDALSLAALIYAPVTRVPSANDANYAALETRETPPAAPKPVREMKRARLPINIREWDVPAGHKTLGYQLSQLASYMTERMPAEVDARIAENNDILKRWDVGIPAFDLTGTLTSQPSVDADHKTYEFLAVCRGAVPGYPVIVSIPGSKVTQTTTGAPVHLVDANGYCSGKGHVTVTLSMATNTTQGELEENTLEVFQIRKRAE